MQQKNFPSCDGTELITPDASIWCWYISGAGEEVWWVKKLRLLLRGEAGEEGLERTGEDGWSLGPGYAVGESEEGDGHSYCCCNSKDSILGFLVWHEHVREFGEGVHVCCLLVGTGVLRSTTAPYHSDLPEYSRSNKSVWRLKRGPVRITGIMPEERTLNNT